MRATGDAAPGTMFDGVDAPGRDQPRGHRALRKGRVSLPGQVYFVTAVTSNRARHFSNFTVAAAVAACFLRADLFGRSTLLAWVLMPDHLHCLVELGEAGSLSKTIDALKSATARAGNRAAGRSGAFWARGFHDRALREDDDVRAAARYLVGNPLRAGLVDRIGDYPFWDAVWV